jgi:hypothetical protein
MANDNLRIKEGEKISALQFLKSALDRINPLNPAEDERRGVKLNAEGYVDGEFGGNIFPIRFEKIDMNTEKQYFPNGDFTIVKKVNMNT